VTAAEESTGAGEPVVSVGTWLDSGDSATFPLIEILTGRAFLTGKSGSGKSNSANVIIEELLDHERPLAVVDTDGEYYGLKEEYELLHVAASDDEADMAVGPEHAEKLADLAIEQNVPVIVDVSGFVDEDEARELVAGFARRLFVRAKELKKPFPLFVEEAHEYIPQSGKLDDCGRVLKKIAKRGRKHGLGIIAISQRPAAVDKDLITQANLVLWHRLTWDNDTKVVSRILGAQYADAIEGLEDGEAFVMADWLETIQRLQFRRQRTYDAGERPGLEDEETPELKSISGDVLDDLKAAGDQRRTLEDEVEHLREQVSEKESRIEELEETLEQRAALSEEAEGKAVALADAIRQEIGAAVGEAQSGRGTADEVTMDVERVIQRVEEAAAEPVEELEAEVARLESEVDRLEGELAEAESARDAAEEDAAELRERAETAEGEVEDLRETLSSVREQAGAIYEAAGGEAPDAATGYRQAAEAEADRVAELEAQVEELQSELADARETVEEDDTQEVGPGGDDADTPPGELTVSDLLKRLQHEEVSARIDRASEAVSFNAAREHYVDALRVLVEAEQSDDAPLTTQEVLERLELSDLSTVGKLLSALAGDRSEVAAEPIGLVEKEAGQDIGEPNRYRINRETLANIEQHAQQRAELDAAFDGI
jgi:uncharacterized coiled-coil DUF342 family protein